MRISNPRPSPAVRATAAPTRDEINVGMGFPRVHGAPPPGPPAVGAPPAPLGPAPHAAGLNDSPLAQRQRMDA